MSRLSLTFFLEFAVTALCVVSAQAANIKLSLQYAGSYDSSFNSKGFELDGIAYFLPPTDIHEFNVFMTITGLAAGEDVETVVFDALLGQGVTPLSVANGGAYQTASLDGFHDAAYKYDPPPNTTNVCGTTGAGCQLVFSNDQDAGSNANDLKAITMVANSIGSTDFTAFAGVHYRHPGETEGQFGTDVDNTNLTGPLYVGSFWVNWDGSVDGTGQSYVGVSDPANVSSPWSTRKSSGNVQALYGPATVDQDPKWKWGFIDPEPSTLLLLGIGATSLLGYRKAKSHG